MLNIFEIILRNAIILKYISFLGYDKDHLLIGLDVMPDSVMNKIFQL